MVLSISMNEAVSSLNKIDLDSKENRSLKVSTKQWYQKWTKDSQKHIRDAMCKNWVKTAEPKTCKEMQPTVEVQKLFMSFFLHMPKHWTMKFFMILKPRQSYREKSNPTERKYESPDRGPFKVLTKSRLNLESLWCDSICSRIEDVYMNTLHFTKCLKPWGRMQYAHLLIRNETRIVLSDGVSVTWILSIHDWVYIIHILNLHDTHTWLKWDTKLLVSSTGQLIRDWTNDNKTQDSWSCYYQLGDVLNQN